ncbi:MAG: hypothetical protein KF849_16615 [Rhizobiaceae bacterium]|nr:hypothetical protein [Rhizobiaceae bacterium]
MLAVLRPAGDSRQQAGDLNRAEMAARVAMASFVEDTLTFGPRPQASPYRWFSAGFVLTGAVLGAVFLFGPL